jgi:RelA/SpoT family (p)ppGpp synthetase
MAGDDSSLVDNDCWSLLSTHPQARVDAVKACVADLLLQVPENVHLATKPEPGLEAARLLAKMRVDPVAVGAALLSVYPLAVLFPPETPRKKANAAPVAPIVAELHHLLEGELRLRSIRFDALERDDVEALRKLFLAMARDVRVVLLALARRVVAMRAIEDAPPEQAQTLAQETLDVFAPLANRLGIWQFKSELEDRAFQVLKPDMFAELQRLVAERSEQRQAFIDEVLSALSNELEKAGIEATVKGRPKHIHSIYKKMQQKQVSFDQLYDVSAVRVTVTKLADCYAVLGVVHSTWTPIKSEFDDYIALPKHNGYQSLHTAVVGPRGRPVEVQIRTREMHQFAEFGVAAHWAYKEQKGHHNLGRDRFMLLRQLLDWEKEVIDPLQFAEHLKTDIFSDRVFVFTPSGDIIDLAKGSTPVDFAYRVHTMVGHRCKGARVNDQIVPLDYQLKTGERVEVLTHKTPRPSRDWMNPSLGYIFTLSARNKVKAWFREQGRAEAIVAGKEAIHKELQRLDLAHSDLNAIAAEMKYPDLEELYAHVGFGDRRAQHVASVALALEKRHAPATIQTLELPPIPPRPKAPRGVVFDGVDDVMGQRARCCNPLPGDDVVGFVTRGRGLIIHRRDCTQVTDSKEPERVVDIEWTTRADELHDVDIEVLAQTRAGLLADLFKLLTHLGAHVVSVNAQSQNGELTRLNLRLECRSSRHMLEVMERLDHHRDVQEVRRILS